MIKFFRKIRQRLLTENKFSKYLIYAIGEIVLVVIGILIALSINNWNEENKSFRQEKKLLYELVNNLDANIATLKASNLQNSETIRGIDIILDHFNNPDSNDSLEYFLRQAYYKETLQLSTATFAAIKTLGLDIIKNDQVKLSISELFDVDYPNQTHNIDEVGNTIRQPWVTWIFYNRHHIDQILSTSDPQKEEGSQFIINFLEGKKIWKTAIIDGNQRLLEKTMNTKILVEKYLQNEG